FVLHGCVLSWSGDTLALTKLISLTGHNSYKGCRYCNIKGIYSSHVYYPTTPPRGQGETYDPANLPLRSYNEYKRQIQEIQNAQTTVEQNQAIRHYGISSKKSVLFNFNSTSFPESFPVDIMHLFYENIAGCMLNYWMGSFFTDYNQNNGEYILSKEMWNKIGKEMESAKKTIPSSLGHPLRNIGLHHNGYKAEEWSNWITMYSLPFLKNRLPKKCYKGWGCS
ncbi:hypothetical protein C2G38_1952520, partial [Gigaspora rosea]